MGSSAFWHENATETETTMLTHEPKNKTATAVQLQSIIHAVQPIILPIFVWKTRFF